MTQRPPNRRPKHAKGSGRPGPHGGPNVSLHGDTPDRVTLFGVHAVAAALANPARVVLKIMATENAERRVADAIAERKISVERVRPKDLDRLLGADTVHQGIAAEVRPVEDAELGALVERARGGAPLVVLDQVTDPHNVGAVLRSAAVFGAAGLVMTARHSPPLNGTLAKAASGAMEIVPIALEQNLARTLQALKAEGVTVIGFDGEGDGVLDAEPLAGALAFVFGAEGKGLRQLTRETCDRVCRIATADTLSSLNVSNAAAIALHLAAMRRRERGD